MQNTKEKLPNVALSYGSDLPLLIFLWRWKVSTTAAMSRAFYPTRSAYAAYRRLWMLERAGFIKARADETAKHYIWTLDKRGFSVVYPRIQHMKEEGYLSENLRHDLLVTAIHLGDGLFGNGNALEYFTEQELRRIDPDFFPEWVPQSRRRPDGYWGINEAQGCRVVALEVELSAKTDTEYESIARFYDETAKIYQVLWVVSRASFAQKIHDIMERFSRRGFKHSFVLLDPIYTQGWQSNVFCGQDTGKTVNNLLGNSSSKDPQLVSCQLSLDTRKTPHKSAHCEVVRPASFIY